MSDKPLQPKRELRFSSILQQPALWVFLGYGIFIYLALPSGVVAMSDDFGYLGSVIETIQRHRPWTDDWLEPWSASFTAIAAIFYKITGSFQVAIHGLQAICAVAACAGTYSLCRLRDISSSKSIAISILGLTYPALLWGTLDFTAFALYIPCLFWTIWAAGKRRWGIFYIAWAVAFSSRQSAIVWLVLPVWELTQNMRSLRQKILWSPPALATLGAVATFALLTLGMNQTQSQRLITDRIFEHVQIAKSFRNLLIAFGTSAVFSGIGALILALGTAGLPIPRNLRTRTAFALVLGVGLFSFLSAYPTVYAEHRNFEGWNGQLYANILIGAGVAGWLMLRFTLRWELFLASIAAGLLVSLRTDVWDYYYADVAILAFFSVVLPRKIEPSEVLERLPRSVGGISVVLFSAFHLCFAYEQKCRIDRDYAICVISEKALRNEEINVTDIGYAPFGFIGWHLHRHFVAHEGRNDPDIGGFMRYQRTGATDLMFSPTRFWRDSKSLKEPEGEMAQRVIRSEIFRVGWIWNQRVTLVRPASTMQIQPGRLTLDHSTYQMRQFPLTNQEWRESIEMLQR